MKTLNAKTIAGMVNGMLKAPGDIVIKHVSTDSRDLPQGALFIAIAGENFDGGDFVEQAVQNGAALVMVNEGKKIPDNIPAIFVDDAIKALGRLAAEYRKLFKIPVIAVTGSVGKTSTKDMIASILSEKYRVHKTKGNYNNEIGLPLSVLDLDESHEAAVFEMGMRGFDEISLLSKIVKPDIAVITNIGISHIERLGTRQNILKAKLEILEGMDSNGIVVLNGDDELLSGLRGLLKQKTIFYGINEGQDIWAYDLSSKGEKGVSFQVQTPRAEIELFIPAPGMHNVHNALAGIAIAQLLDMNADEIKAGLMSYSGEHLRLNIKEKDGIKYIDDSYNAAPSSLKAAVEVLCDIGSGMRKWAVLGDMLELGSWTEEAHRSVGRLAARFGLDYLVGIGEYAKWYKSGVEEVNGSKTVVALFEDTSGAKAYIQALKQKGDILLFKGSRRMKLDIMLNELLKEGLEE